MKEKRKFGWREKFRYWFDCVMAKGTVSLVALLFMITFVVVVIAGILVVLFDGEPGSQIPGSIWLSLMHAVDAGTLAGDSGSFLFIFMMTLVTICGLFITSLLIGIINTGMQSKMESLRKGKSKILEEDHTVILGFNDSTYTLLNELIEANRNQKREVVAIMDNGYEKEEMEEKIRQRFEDTATTTVICRHGKITDFNDLSILSVESARSIIINTHDDFMTIKAILAVTSLLKKVGNTHTYITAVINSKENVEAATIAGEGKAEILFFENTIARIVAHTCRHSGFSSVFTELFSFSGDEIYIEEIKEVWNQPISQLNLHFPHSTVIGLKKKGEIMINPAQDTIVEKGDQLILLAQDDGSSVYQKQSGLVDLSLIRKNNKNAQNGAHKMMILGYGARIARVLKEEDHYMAPGSRILVAVQPEYVELARHLTEMKYENISVEVRSCNIYIKENLYHLLEWNPDSVLVCSLQKEDPQVDDSKTLLVLLQLRALARERQMNYLIVSEMRSVENQSLAQVTEVRDFIISSNITSLMVAQISQTRELKRIFEEILSDKGSEIYMKPASDYIELGKKVNLYTVNTAVSYKNQVLIGYRKDVEGSDVKIVINPAKEEQVIFNENDQLIILSED